MHLFGYFFIWQKALIHPNQIEIYMQAQNIIISEFRSFFSMVVINAVSAQKAIAPGENNYQKFIRINHLKIKT